MKEIKFRAWIQPTEYASCPKEDSCSCCMGRYTKPFTFGDYDGKYLHGDEQSLESNKFQTVKIEQFTGLRDKSGKEIYEGDIVKEPDSGVETPVVWEQAQSCGSCFQAGFDFPFDADVCEVIGNIHENPDLLNT